MTAQGEDILAWLDRAITMRERMAQETADEFGSVWTADDGMESVRSDTGADVLDEPGAPRAYIAANDPASVLRRCAADRRLIAAHPITRDVIAVQPDGNHGFGCFVCHNEDLLTIGNGWCGTLRALAEGYGWTEGER